MNDFFSNLIARSFSETPAIQPRLSSRFETPAENFGESNFVETNLTAENKTAKENFPNHGSSQIKNEQSGDAINSTRKTDSSTSQKNLSVENRNTDTRESLAEKSQRPIKKNEVEFISVPSKATQSSPEIRPNLDSRIQKTFSGKNHARKNQQDSNRAENLSAKTSPTINVTIGRVEVRAIQNSAPARKVVQPASPLFSLADYLKERDGGSR